jgi:hypothetical protein
MRTIEQELAAWPEHTRQPARVRHVRLGLAAPAQPAPGREPMGPLDERRPQRRSAHGCQPRGVNLDPGACHRTAPPGVSWRTVIGQPGYGFAPGAVGSTHRGQLAKVIARSTRSNVMMP